MSKTICQKDSTNHSIVRNKVGGWHHLQGAGPEPTVDVDGLKVGSLTTFNLLVTQTTGCVDILDTGSPHESDNKVFFCLALQTDHVHAHLSAVVAASEPVPPGVPQDGFITGPGHPVALGIKVKVSN